MMICGSQRPPIQSEFDYVQCGLAWRNGKVQGYDQIFGVSFWISYGKRNIRFIGQPSCRISIKSLDEVCQWIGEGIGATDLEIRCAKMRIISTFIQDFRHFNTDGTTEVCHFDSIATKWVQGECPYTALTNWIVAAKKEESYKFSPFARYAKFISSALKSHNKDWDFTAKTQYKSPQQLAQKQKASLAEKLMYKDSRVAFVLLWVTLEPLSATKMDGSFEDWSFPHIEIELDHSGIFRVLPSGEIFYEGGETKGLYTGISTSSVSSAEFTGSTRSEISTSTAISHDRPCRAFGFRKKDPFLWQDLPPESWAKSVTVIERRTRPSSPGHGNMEGVASCFTSLHRERLFFVETRKPRYSRGSEYLRLQEKWDLTCGCVGELMIDFDVLYTYV